MKFGVMVAPKIEDWQLLQHAENLGYDSGWVPDSHMIWSDCYGVLALAAHHTSKIRLGTGVAIAPARLAPVTAHSIATINRIAPGRVFLGIGTGHTSMRVMGMNPMKPKAFRDYLRVTRALLHGEEVDYELDGETRDIKFLHPDGGYVDVEHPVPIYVAANGPLALKAAGAFGDGRVSSFVEREAAFAASMDLMREGASGVGRELPGDFHTAVLGFACVLRPGESPTSDRVIDEVGAMATSTLHYWYEIYKLTGSDAIVSGRCRPIWEEYLDWVERMETPPEKRYQQIHLGHCTFVPPAERRFVTEELINVTGGLVGEPEQLIEKIRASERAGLTEVSLLPSMAYARQNIEDFAKHVIEKY